MRSSASSARGPARPTSPPPPACTRGASVVSCDNWPAVSPRPVFPPPQALKGRIDRGHRLLTLGLPRAPAVVAAPNCTGTGDAPGRAADTGDVPPLGERGTPPG